MTATQNRNAYLDQAVAQGAQLEQVLRAKQQAPMASVAAPAPAAPPPPGAAPGRSHAVAPDAEPTSHASDVRVTGVGRWKTIVIPPGAFVVHTRRGRSEPLHVGLGVWFRFNPATDSYLVVPGAMQTILISAYCICRELQGVLVQAYVQ